MGKLNNEDRGTTSKRSLAEVPSRVEGDTPPIDRVRSGLWSWDRAVGFQGELGTPDRGIIELYGDEHTGKSTLAYYLISQRAGSGAIVVADLEGSIDANYIEQVSTTAGHRGPIRIVDYTESKKGKTVPRSHEAMVEEAIDALLEDDVVASLVDSYGAFASIAARGKHLGERTVGQEARTLNEAAKRVQTWLRTNDNGKWYFVINHTSPNIGGHGFSTPGGRKTKYLAIIRAWIRRKANDWPKGSGNFVAEITFQKLKYGIKGRKCWVYFIPGYGISKEMTAIYECIEMKIAKADTVVKLEVMDGEDKKFKWISQGRISTLARKALDPDKYRKTFQPFFDALSRYDDKHPFRDA